MKHVDRLLNKYSQQLPPDTKSLNDKLHQLNKLIGVMQGGGYGSVLSAGELQQMEQELNSSTPTNERFKSIESKIDIEVKFIIKYLQQYCL